jgi:hypothetical protein
MESDLCYHRGEHFDCNMRGCSCGCHPRPGRAPQRPGGLGPQTGMTGVSWHPEQDDAA